MDPSKNPGKQLQANTSDFLTLVSDQQGSGEKISEKTTVFILIYCHAHKTWSKKYKNFRLLREKLSNTDLLL